MKLEQQSGFFLLRHDYSEAAHLWAAQADYAFRHSGKPDHFYPSKLFPTSYDAFLFGAMSEAGLHQQLDEPYRPVLFRDHGDGGIDLTIDGMGIQLKATGYHTGHLLFDNEAQVRADILVLSVLPYPENWRYQRLAGWMDKDAFLRTAHRTWYRRGVRLEMSQRELNPITTLLRTSHA